MTINGTIIESVLKENLQNNLEFRLKNKIYKKGRLILFKQVNFYIEILLDGKNKYDKFEIPIPFFVESWKDNLIYFDYRLNALAGNDKELLNILQNIAPTKKCKFYDTILEIQVHESRK